jgi:hypothetical protein
MKSKELIDQSKAEIAMFHRPARATSCLMMEMIESQAAKIAELEKVGLVLVSIIESHHDSAYCDVFDYDELEAAKKILKERGE